jgi:hypothetical protein
MSLWMEKSWPSLAVRERLRLDSHFTHVQRQSPDTRTEAVPFCVPRSSDWQHCHWGGLFKTPPSPPIPSIVHGSSVCLPISPVNHLVTPQPSELSFWITCLRFEVLTTMNIAVFCDVTPCRMIYRYRSFRWTYYLHLQGRKLTLSNSLRSIFNRQQNACRFNISTIYN